MLVVLHVAECLQIALGEALGQTLGQERHPVGATLGPALDDGAGQGVDQRVDGGPAVRELLGDDSEGGAGRLTDAEGQVAGLAAHGDDEIPARRGARVDHEVLDEAHAQVARRLVAEGVHVRLQVEVVVDRLRHVGDPDPPGSPLRHLHGREGGIVPPDRDELAHPELLEHRYDGVEVRDLGGGIGAGGAEHGSAPEVDAADVVDGEGPDALDAAVHDLVEAAADPHHLHVLEEGADGRRADHAVDAGGGTTADDDGEL